MDLINPEEIVSISEKIHGTWCCMGFADGEYVVTSKGLSEKGLAFKLNEANENNLYVRQFLKFGGKEIVDALLKLTEFTTVYVLGEIFGNGVQDLSYGQPTQSFRMFDIYGRKTNDSGVTDGGYFTTARLISTVADLATLGVNVELVPILYQGPFSFKVVDEYTNGKETVSGKESHIREGVVIKVMSERTNHIIHRTILKSVSEAYLTRKGNTTEYN
jgi:RNA ligase (TIGR02306 family)